MTSISNLKFKLKVTVYIFIFISFGFTGHCANGIWFSPATQTEIAYTVTDSKTPLKDATGNYITIVYLEHLAIKNLSGFSNTENKNWLLKQGYRIITLDYKNHPKTVSPLINQDITAINQELANGKFLTTLQCSNYKSYILFEGYRIARDIDYFKDNPEVYNTPAEYKAGDMLHMDIIYPANPSHPVPVVLSFSYSNSYAFYDKNLNRLSDAGKDLRLHLPYTLAGFKDSILEGAPASGIAWVIADHPKYCPWGSGKPVNGPNDAYKSFESNPDTAQKVKSAIRTLRTKGAMLGLSGQIGIYGFSRGSTAGSMALGTKSVLEVNQAGFYQNTDDQIQAAILGPGVFDYTIIYNTLNDGDKNLEQRCPLVWGNLKQNYKLWKTMGSEYLIESSKTPPVLLFYNTTDDAYYGEQITHLRVKLDRLNITNTLLKDYGKGHSVPQTPEDLKILYNFLKAHLNPPKVN
ncbi:alpha/beta hydrolase family protein [Formosa sp. S-31]|uniref:alpha/beta hydrolase family protein n=1 Tax=Formosa sp. S-31 TaxID=2790949 RepID=UPI003EBDB984